MRQQRMQVWMIQTAAMARGSRGRSSSSRRNKGGRSIGQGLGNDSIVSSGCHRVKAAVHCRCCWGCIGRGPESTGVLKRKLRVLVLLLLLLLILVTRFCGRVEHGVHLMAIQMLLLGVLIVVLWMVTVTVVVIMVVVPMR